MSDYNSMTTEPDAHRDTRQKGKDPQSGQSSATQEVNYKQFDDNINGDVTVRRWREQYPHDLHNAFCGRLLTIIVEQSAGWLDPRYDDWRNAHEALAKWPDLMQKLLTAWRSMSFRDILDLDYLRPGASPVQPPEFESFDEQRMKIVERAVEKAWQVPYQGTHHQLLFRNINTMFKPKPYLNFCAVVQSSGTGKSRMVYEQANLVFTLPINIRTSEGIKLACPPSDPLLHTYFTETSSDSIECWRRYMVFFQFLFSHAAGELAVFANQPRRPQGEFASMWRELMDDKAYRHNFYAKVVEMCKSVSGNSGLVSQAQTSLNTLVNTLDACCESTTSVKIMIYIDEAHELKRIYLFNEKQTTQLDILCSVLTVFSTEPLFCLFLSTQSLLRFFAPPSWAAPSERAQQHNIELLAPVTETPFDCAPNLEVIPGVLHLGDLSKIGYLAKWGRPLWWTRINNQIPSKDKEVLEDDLIDFARMKLLSHHAISIPHGAVSSTTRLAVLDVLLALDFEPRHDQTLQEDMVESHMRIAYSVPQHREYFWSGYPSEPLLAEAAAQQIHEFEVQSFFKNYDVMVDILQSTSNISLIDFGQRGEVVMRLLLMRAYIDGVSADHPHEPNFSQGCKLITFINKLFSLDAANKVLASKPDNLKDDATFREVFQKSVVRFTHFVKAGDMSALTTKALFAAFSRGMAFICHPKQGPVDLAIPILLDEAYTLQESAMSAILVEVKGHLKGHGPMAYSFSQDEVDLFPEHGEDKSADRPYITLIAELGAQPKGSQPEGRSSTPTDIYVSPQPEVEHHTRDTHPRFSVTTYGCSHTLYKVIRPGQYYAYETLLATSHNLLKEHGHKDAGSLSAMMKLKPHWECGENSYHWVNSEMLND